MWKIIKWPTFYFLVQILLVILFAYLFILNGGNPSLFGEFIGNNKIYLVLIISFIFMPLLFYNYNKLDIKESKINIKEVILLIVLGIILSFIYNFFAYYVDIYLLKTNLFDASNISITVIVTLILGPIIEELLFRGIMYNEAKKQLSNMKAILIVTTIFALLHLNILQMVYAFALGFILIYVYEKYKSLKAPIIVHMTSNIVSTIFTIYLIKLGFYFNYIIFVILLIILFIIKKLFDYKKI